MAHPETRIQPWMESAKNPENNPSKSKSRLFLTILFIIIAAIAAFLIIRPTPPGTNSKSTASPASQQ